MPVSYTHLDVYKRQVCVCVCVYISEPALIEELAIPYVVRVAMLISPYVLVVGLRIILSKQAVVAVLSLVAMVTVSSGNDCIGVTVRILANSASIANINWNNCLFFLSSISDLFFYLYLGLCNIGFPLLAVLYPSCVSTI